MNRYAYCHNNPIRYVDPTGFAASSYADYFGNSYSNYNDPNYNGPSDGVDSGNSGYGMPPPEGYSSWREFNLTQIAIGARIWELGEQLRAGNIEPTITGNDPPPNPEIPSGAPSDDSLYHLTKGPLSVPTPQLRLYWTPDYFDEGPTGGTIRRGREADEIYEKFFNPPKRDPKTKQGFLLDEQEKRTRIIVQHFTSKENAEKIVNSGMLWASTDTGYAEVMTIDATAKDARNAGARFTEVRVVMVVPVERITLNRYTTQPKARMFATPGHQYIKDFAPFILPGK